MVGEKPYVNGMSEFTIYEMVGKKWPITTAEILKYASNRHFTIQWGHGKEVVNGSKAMQLTP